MLLCPLTAVSTTFENLKRFSSLVFIGLAGRDRVHNQQAGALFALLRPTHRGSFSARAANGPLRHHVERTRQEYHTYI